MGEQRHPTDQAALMAALTTEHFVLQTAASTASSEEASRATLYVMALSSSLVAIGFTVESAAFPPVAATVLSTVFVLGIFTTVRMVDTGLQNLTSRSAIARIRRYYRGLAPEAAAHILPWGDDETTEAMATLGVSRRRDWLIGFFTAAAMVAAINSIVAGAGIGLLVVAATDRLLPGVLVGLVAAVAHMSVFYLYQRRRYRGRSQEWARATVGSGEDGSPDRTDVDPQHP